MNKNIANGIACLFAGALTPLAFAPYNYYLVAILTPAVLFNVWLNDTPGAAFRNGYLFGLGMFGTGVSWLHISINLFGGVNLAGALLITLMLVVYLSIYPALAGYFSRRFFPDNKPLLLIVVFPSLWILSEWCRALIIYLGFSWLQLGYSQTDAALNGVAALAGIYGVSLALLITTGALLTLFHVTMRFKLVTLVAIISLWLCAFMLQKHNWTEVKQEHFKVALIQGGIPQQQKWQPELLQQTLDLYRNLSEPYWEGDLIIWPETAIPAFYHRVKGFILALYETANSTNTTLLTGIPVKDPQSSDYFNSIMMLDEDISIYHKRHLVPFGEYLPMDSVLRPILNFLKIPMSDFSQGPSEMPLLSNPDIKIGVSICYEDTFGNEVIQALPGAEVLVNVSNDAWFGDSMAPHQHMQMARMRAIETGRYMLRATNTGITAIIDEKGGVIAQTNQFKADSIATEIKLFGGLTPYARFGDVPVLVGIVLILLIIKFRERRNVAA